MLSERSCINPRRARERGQGERQRLREDRRQRRKLPERNRRTPTGGAHLAQRWRRCWGAIPFATAADSLCPCRMMLPTPLATATEIPQTYGRAGQQFRSAPNIKEFL